MENKCHKYWSYDSYKFKSFKVYWAYRWYRAEEIDRIGVLGGTILDKNIRKDCGYRFGYCPNNELEYYKSITKYIYPIFNEDDYEWITIREAKPLTKE